MTDRAVARFVRVLTAASLYGLAGPARAAEPSAMPGFRAPITAENDRTVLPPPPFVEPVALELPSDEPLATITVRNRTVTVNRVARGVRTPKVEGAAPTVVTAAADAAVSAKDPGKNVGTWGRNPVRGGDDGWRYLVRFDGADAAQTDAARVVLRLAVHELSAGDGPATLSVRALAANDWDEATVTWASQPAASGAPVTASVAKAGNVDFDVTSLVNGASAGEVVGFVVEGDARQVSLRARELKGGAASLLLFSQANVDARAAAPPAPDPLAARAFYEADGEAFYFEGSGRGGAESKERLIIEDCTFVIDFTEGDFGKWDAARSAIYVDGYAEVVVRRCRFVSKGLANDPVRKTNASLTVYDTRRVLVEDCYFEGKTNWMRGHLTVFCSGPTTIRRVEVAGQKQGDEWVCGGGIWVGNGLGEGKAGTLHEDEPELMLYPSGPLLIEDCYVHDQRGKFNTDGIYVQSIHPYVIRNCRVTNWGSDALVDVGFRDTAGKTFKGKPLANHGAVGVIENCEFERGMIKDSVGVAGGLVFRNNLCKNVWMMPYVFDGGHWYVVGNRFEDMTGVLLSGHDGGWSGWAPKEGMFERGSKLMLFGNAVQYAAGAKPNAVFVSGNPTGVGLGESLVADHNAYGLPPALKMVADDRAGKRKLADVASWKAAGFDAHSQWGAEASAALPAIPEGAVTLPGGLAMKPAGAKVGLTGPVGPKGNVGAR